MASHDYHPSCPGYAPEQIFHDGCGECEYRGRDFEAAIAHMDSSNFTRAWVRAADWQASTPPSGERAEHISAAESQFLKTLWLVQLRLHDLTGLPYGRLPSAR